MQASRNERRVQKFVITPCGVAYIHAIGAKYLDEVLDGFFPPLRFLMKLHYSRSPSH